MVIETDSMTDLSAVIEMDSRTVYMSAWSLETWKAEMKELTMSV